MTRCDHHSETRRYFDGCPDCGKDLHRVRHLFEALWTPETRLFFAAFWAGSMVTVAVVTVVS